MGDINYRPDSAYDLISRDCDWKFSLPKKKEFLFVLRFHELQVYGMGNRVELPDGKLHFFTFKLCNLYHFMECKTRTFLNLKFKLLLPQPDAIV